MKKRLTLFLIGMLVSVCTAFAQSKISGTVVSQEDGEPVIGASVKIVGTQQGVVTNVDGKFSIAVPAGKKIEVSYIGMKAQRLTPKNGMKVVLAPDATVMDEVVVTGIQKMDKRLFTGATTKIDAEETKLSGVADVTRSLEGRAAGVSVQNVSGTFGTAPKIRVRGATSIYGSTSGPLWVVDGVILENAVDVSADDLSSGDATTLISNAIAGLNADDIESFQVLKDGSATSIYGARAMSGVVVITTKKGRVGHSSINYTGEFTYRLKPSYRDYNISNSQEQMGIYKEMAAKGWLEFAQVANASAAGLYGKMYGLMNTYDPATGDFVLPYTEAAVNDFLREAEFRNTDWFDLLFNNNIIQNHSVSISSGTEKASVYASLSVMNDPGWTKNQDVERYTANINASYKLHKNLTATLRMNTSYVKQKAPGTLNQNTDPVSGAVSRDFDINPFSYALNTSRVLDPNQIYTRNYASFSIFKELDNNFITKEAMDTKFQGELEWKPILGLSFNLLGAYRVNPTTLEHEIHENSNQAEAYRAGVNNPNIMYSNPYLYTDPDKPNSWPISVMEQGGINILKRNQVKQLDFRFTVNYNHVWSVKGEETHIFNALAGMEANRADYEASKHESYGVNYNKARLVTITPEFYKQAKEEGTELIEFGRSNNRRLAYFGNVNYSYKGRYSANFTARYDGSNQLGKSRQSRWLPTWNVSASWNAHEEPFFQKFIQNTNGAWSHASLRASYSLVGEFAANLTNLASAVSKFGVTNVWRPQGDQQEIGNVQTRVGNEDLTYEKKHEFNVGANLGFLNNRINVETDIYWRDCFDLLGPYYHWLFGDQYVNVANMKTRGVETTISSQNIVGKDFQWSTDLTFSYNHSEITNLKSLAQAIELVQGYGYALQGYPHRALFSYQFMGLNDEGLPQVINEKGEVTTSDVYFQHQKEFGYLKYEGPTEPTITGGLNNTFRWKNWRLNVFVTYSFGNKLRLDPVFSASYSDLAAMPKEFKNRWVMPGDEKKTDIPAIASVRQVYNNPYLVLAYNAYNYSTARVADGGFVRLKNVSLTYDFSPQLISKIGLKTASLKLDATNLCLLYADKKLNGQDPEFVNSGGVAMPLSKQFTFTVRLGI